MDIAINGNALTQEMDWLDAVIAARIARHFRTQDPDPDLPEPPDLFCTDSVFANTLRTAGLGAEARMILALALAPFLRPGSLDPFVTLNPVTNRSFAEFYMPHSGEGPIRASLGTAMFLVGGEDVIARRAALDLLSADGALERAGVMVPVKTVDAAALLQPLDVAPVLLGEAVTGQKFRPEFRADFPARRLTTRMSWDDLILSPQTRHDIEEILAWITHGGTLETMSGIGRLIKPGFRSLFHGPPGTGKTLAATLIGQRTERDVYRVDLSMVVSKWIGETEKNLARVFDQAEGQGWILFFDEADALFGKRTDVSQSNDRHANQEVSYILQRVEDFDGVILLASNLRGNIDQAFARRFQSMIPFALPKADARFALWKQAFSETDLLAPDVDLRALAEQHELSGGAIVNAARYGHLARLRAGADTVTFADLQAGIARELHKSGKIAGAVP